MRFYNRVLILPHADANSRRRTAGKVQPAHLWVDRRRKSNRIANEDTRIESRARIARNAEVALSHTTVPAPRVPPIGKGRPEVPSKSFILPHLTYLAIIY